MSGTDPTQAPATWWWFGFVFVVAVAVSLVAYALIRRRVAASRVSYATEERKTIDATFAIGGTVLVFAVLGVLAALVACLGLASGEAGPFSSIFGLDMLIAAAAGSMGALAGFIFGIPRTTDPASRAAVAGAAAKGGTMASTNAAFAANTNLERVSDWLTTLLIGATLVQLRDVPDWTKRFVAYLGNGPISNAKLAPFICVYFFGLAFLGIYLITRLYLTTALARILGSLTGGEGVSDVAALSASLLNARASADPAVLVTAIGLFENWPLRGDDGSDPGLNAEAMRILAKYLGTGRADDPARRLTQLKAALSKAATDEATKSRLKADFDGGALTTGDATVDASLRKSLD